MIKYYLLLIIVLIVIYEVYHQKEHIQHFINGNKVDIPTPKYILDKVNDIFYDICNYNQTKYTLIDIGSGNGKTIKDFCKDNLFDKCRGVEIDDTLHNIAVKQNKNPNITLIHTDATTFNYVNKPSIIYMYEPFYDIEYEKSLMLYNKLFHNIQNNSHNCSYVIYVSGHYRRDLHNNQDIFLKNNFDIIYVTTLSSILSKRYVYVARCNKCPDKNKNKNKIKYCIINNYMYKGTRKTRKKQVKCRDLQAEAINLWYRCVGRKQRQYYRRYKIQGREKWCKNNLSYYRAYRWKARISYSRIWRPYRWLYQCLRPL